MPMPVFNWSSTTHKRLSTCLLLIGSAVFPGMNLHAETRVDPFELDTFSQITDLTEFPYFKELYYFPLKSDPITTPADEFLVLNNFFTLDELVSHGEDPDDLDDDEYEKMNFASYTTYSDKVAVRPEMGYLGFKFAADDVSVGVPQAVGFIRKSKRVKDLPSVKLEGLFTGATGTIAWNTLDYTRETVVDLNYSYGGATFSRTVESSYTLYSSSLTLSSIKFPVTDEVDSDEWSLGASNLDYLGDGEFVGLVNRSDYLTREDLEGLIPDGVDPETIWNKLYVLRFTSGHDADRDHIPDILDQSGSVTTFPWYADLATYTNWYWSHWLGFWIYSDRLSDWDYWQYLGWSYVSEAGDRDAFWFFAPSLSPGWLITSDSWYPTVYDTSSGNFLYIVVIDDGTGYVYSYADDTWTPVNP